MVRKPRQRSSSIYICVTVQSYRISFLSTNRMIRIPPEAFSALEQELVTRPLAVNMYRKTAGVGRSQTFGVVNRRCLPADYSRLCWMRPLLYKLLLEFGAKYISIPFTSITVNDCFRAAPHRDKGNVGDSVVVAFGDYQGGGLRMHEGVLEGVYDIKHAGIQADFSKITHSVEPFEGRRFSLVFYTASDKFGSAIALPPPSVALAPQNGKLVFKRGDEICTGLAHPLKGKKKGLTFTRVIKDVVVEFE